MDFVVVVFAFVSFVLISRNSSMRVCVLPVRLFTAFSFSGVVLLLKRVLNAPYLAVVFLTRDVSSLFDFPSPWIGFVGERERERERNDRRGRTFWCALDARRLSIRVEIVDKRQERDALKAQRALFVGEIYYTRTEREKHVLSNHHHHRNHKEEEDNDDDDKEEDEEKHRGRRRWRIRIRTTTTTTTIG
jgi:hypothetical protein